MSSGLFWTLIVGALIVAAVLAKVLPDPFHRTTSVEDPFAKKMLEGLARTNQLLDQLRQEALAFQPDPGPAVSVAPCMCHILWHASDATDADPVAATDIHLLTFSDREERIWIDARDPIRVKFLDMDPTCFADAAEMSETAILRVFADYHVDVHYPETREWMRQVMRRCPQGAFVFQVPADNIIVGGIVYMRDGVLMPLSPGERARVTRVLRRAHLQACPDYENLSTESEACAVCAEGQADIRELP